jgi:uncharacterized protein (TIGR00661 family)
MIRILYAVNGDGLGHTTRSIPIIKALSKKYNVKVIVGSKRSCEFMNKYIKNVTPFEGLRFVYDKNSVKLYKTIGRNAKIIFSKSSNFKTVFSIIKKFRPDVIVTDCDYLTINVSNLFNIPLICVCNIHAMTELKYDVPKKHKKAYYTMNALIKIFTSNIGYHVITTFFYPPIRHKYTFLYPPVLRQQILEMNPIRKNYYLVYQTTGMSPVSTNKKLIRVLKSVKAQFVVYGFEKEEVDKNITFRKTNNDQFFKDFKDCRACIANGGFSFISEAVSLHKPVLSIPIKGTFEQTLNAMQIKELGYGDMCDFITTKKLKNFIKHNEKYYNNLKNYKKEDNSRIILKVEELIKEVTK